MKKFFYLIVLIIGALGVFSGFSRPNFIYAEEEHTYILSGTIENGYTLSQDGLAIYNGEEVLENIDIEKIFNYINTLDFENINIIFSNFGDVVDVEDFEILIDTNVTISGNILSNSEKLFYTSQGSNVEITLNCNIENENGFVFEGEDCILNVKAGNYVSKTNNVFTLKNAVLNVVDGNVYNKCNLPVIEVVNSTITLDTTNIYSTDINNSNLIQFSGTLIYDVYTVINNSTNNCFFVGRLNDIEDRMIISNEFLYESQNLYSYVEFENEQIYHKTSGQSENYSFYLPDLNWKNIEFIDCVKVNYIDLVTLEPYNQESNGDNLIYLDKYNTTKNLENTYEYTLSYIAQDDCITTGWFDDYDTTEKGNRILSGEKIETLQIDFSNENDEINLYAKNLNYYENFFYLMNGDNQSYNLYLSYGSENQLTIVENKPIEFCIAYLKSFDFYRYVNVILGDYFNRSSSKYYLKLYNFLEINTKYVTYFGNITVDSNLNLDENQALITFVDAIADINFTTYNTNVSNLIYINLNSEVYIYSGRYYSTNFDIINDGILTIGSGQFGKDGIGNIQSLINFNNHGALEINKGEFYSTSCNVVNKGSALKQSKLSIHGGNFFTNNDVSYQDLFSANFYITDFSSVEVNNCNLNNTKGSIIIAKTNEDVSDDSTSVTIHRGEFLGSIYNGYELNSTIYEGYNLILSTSNKSIEITGSIYNYSYLSVSGTIQSTIDDENYSIYNYGDLFLSGAINLSNGICTDKLIEFINYSNENKFVNKTNIFFDFDYGNGDILIKKFDKIENIQIVSDYFKLNAENENIIAEILMFVVEFDENAYKIIGYNPYLIDLQTNLIIPDYFDDNNGSYPITEISDGAFKETDIESIVFNRYIENISDSAFKDCIYLSLLDFSQCENLKYIGDYAFYNTLIEEIVLPESVLSLGEYSFTNCDNLTLVILSRLNEETDKEVTHFNENTFDENVTTIKLLNSNMLFYYTNEHYQYYIENKIFTYDYYLQLIFGVALDRKETTDILCEYNRLYPNTILNIFTQYFQANNFELIGFTNERLLLTQSNILTTLADGSILTAVYKLNDPNIILQSNDTFYQDYINCFVSTINRGIYDNIGYEWYIKIDDIFINLENNDNKFETNSLDVGTYTFKVKVIGNILNYTSTSEAQTEVRVMPLSLPVNWTDLTLTYNDTYQKPKAYIMLNNTAVYLSVTGEQVNAGSYTAECSLPNGYENYVLNDAMTSTDFTILKVDVEVYWENLSFVYDGMYHKPDAYFYDVENNKIFLDVVEAQINASDNKYIANCFMPENFENSLNYNLLNASEIFYITQKQIDVLWEDLNFVYNGEYQVPKAYVEYDNEKYYFEVSGKNMNAGTYEVSVENIDTLNDNYSANLGTLYNQFIIYPEKVTVYFENLSFIYNGKSQVPSAYFIDVNNNKQIVSVTGEQVNVGENYICSAIDDFINYEFEGTYSVNFEILPKQLDVVWGNCELTYRGSPIAPNASVDTNIEGETVIIEVDKIYKDVSDSPYTASARFKQTQDNYVLNPETTNALFTINILETEVYYTDLNLVYNGDYQSPSAYIILPNGEKIDIPTYGSAVNHNQKGYPLHSFIDDEELKNNIKLKNDDVTFYINKLPLEAIWEETTFSYDGQPHIPRAHIQTLEGNKYYLNVSGGKINASEIFYVATADKNSMTFQNYVISDNNITTEYKINRKEVDAIWETEDFYFDGKIKKPKAYYKDINGEIHDLNVISSGIVAGSHVAKVENKGIDSNYILADSTMNFTYIINPKKLDVVWSNINTYVYDGNYHIPQATVETGIEGDKVEIICYGEQKNANPDPYLAFARLKQDYQNYTLNLATNYTRYYINQANTTCIVDGLVNDVLSITENDLPYRIKAYASSGLDVKIKINGNSTSNYFMNSDIFDIELYTDESTNYKPLSKFITLDVKPLSISYREDKDIATVELFSENGLPTNSLIRKTVLDYTDRNLNSIIKQSFGSAFYIENVLQINVTSDNKILDYNEEVTLKLLNNFNFSSQMRLIQVEGNQTTELIYDIKDNYIIIKNYKVGSTIFAISSKSTTVFNIISLLGIITIFISLFIILLDKKGSKSVSIEMANSDNNIVKKHKKKKKKQIKSFKNHKKIR